MSLLSRFQKETPEAVERRQDQAIAQFWAWWVAGAREQAAAVFDGHGDHRRLGSQIADQVAAIERGLGIETGEGRTARHLLVVTAAGVRELRDVADRWLAAAPPPDESFEYDNWRRARADPAGAVIVFDGVEVGVDQMAVTIRPTGSLVDVEAWHPSFGPLPDETCGQITFLLLDAVLGERVVEERVGVVGWTHDEPADAVPFLALRSLLGDPSTAG